MAGGLESDFLQCGEHLAAFNRNLKRDTNLTWVCALYLGIPLILSRVHLLSLSSRPHLSKESRGYHLMVFLKLPTTWCHEGRERRGRNLNIITF